MLRFRLAVCVWMAVLLVGIVTRAYADEKTGKAGAPAAKLDEAREDVHQALLAESLGNNEARAQRLQKAWLAAPNLAEVNWHMARVHVDSQWLPVAQAVSQTISDPDLVKYRELRDKAASNVKLLRDLARLSVKMGWRDRARLHYMQVFANSEADGDLRREAAKALDLRPTEGGWISGEDLAARTAQTKAQSDALTKWRPRLEKLKVSIDGDNFTRRDKAITELASIDDPAVIPVLESFLGQDDGRFQEEIVKRLARFPDYAATEALVHFAVLPQSVIVRSEAIKALKERSIHEFCPLMIAALVSPLQSRFEITTLPNGAVTYRHLLVREDRDKKLAALNINVSSPKLTRPPTIYSAPGTRQLIKDDTIWFLQRQVAAQAANQAADVQLMTSLANQPVNDANRRVFPALRETTGQQISDDVGKWWEWWQEYNEYHWPKPTYYTYTTSQTCYYTPPPFYATQPYPAGRRGSCFLAGTPVRSETGLVPIESLQPGDRVLAQDQDSGELTFKTILKTTLRPPTSLVRLKAAGEEITTTLGHPFWVSGFGWKMAKQLKEGDLLHGLGGAVRLESVEKLAKEERAHNLVIEGFNTYFVGQTGLLVHDNEFRKPTRAVVPGLTPEPQKTTAK
jgi:hypothetical protein